MTASVMPLRYRQTSVLRMLRAFWFYLLSMAYNGVPRLRMYARGAA